MKAELTEFLTLARVRCANALQLKMKLANPVRRLKEEMAMLINFGFNTGPNTRSDGMTDDCALTVDQHNVE